MNFDLDKYKQWFLDNEKVIQETFSKFLSYKSISTDPSHQGICCETADWLCSLSQKVGMKVQQLKNSGLPVVFAEHVPKGNVPSVLVYHHYDVQPADPLSLWKGDPFQARWEDGKVFARGASDNKGQCFLTLMAIQALLEMESNLPLHIKLFIEGEEESGSKGTAEVISEQKMLLRADSLCVIDFDLAAPGVPGIALGYRGIVTLEVSYQNADTDLHSGVHGGVAMNPIHSLARTIAAFWDEKGRIAIAGFYDQVSSLSLEEKEMIDFFLSEESYREEYGIGTLCKEEGYSLRESGWIRPTVEVNGIWGGYTGEGFKTVIPALAHAKVSCRIVPNQDPVRIGKMLSAFLQEKAPLGTRVQVKLQKGAPAFFCSPTNSLIRTVSQCLEKVFQAPCKYTLCGGSVPIVEELARAVGGDVALFGFALANDNIHAPNEHFRWENFSKGFLAMAQILWTLAYRDQGVRIS